jgi:CubicO group peptidase (beta-lactamase class C family)
MMSEKMVRSLYRGLLRLHPAAFRERFAEEMLWIFDEIAARPGVRRGMARLYADGFLSLLRQWTVRLAARELTIAVSAPSASINLRTKISDWGQFESAEHALPFYRWLQGAAISLGLLSGVWLMAGWGGHPRAVGISFAAQENPQSGWLTGTVQTETSGDDAAASAGPMMGRSASGYRDGPRAENLHEHQLRQQELAIQIAIDGRSVPGGDVHFLREQGAAMVIPETAASQQFSDWLSSFNSGDRAQMEAFSAHFTNPGEHGANDVMGFFGATGGFNLRKIEESRPAKLTGLVQERDSDQFARFVVEVEAEAPHRITNLDLRAIARPAEFPIERMSETELVAALKAKLEADSAADKFAGTILLAKNGKVIFSGAYGMADREKKIANTLDTKFRIGSMNKMFTATSVLQLVEAGKIKLSDSLGKYIPDYPNKDVARKVTIQHLLTHTGGTGDIFGPQFDEHRKELRTLEDYVKLYGGRSPDYEPGSRWAYSNYGFLLLGVVVERASGKSYYDYVSDHVYRPAGMSSSGSLTEDEEVAGRSIGYTRMGGSGLHPNTDTLPYRGSSAGGGYSTVGDLLRFANALKSDKLLNAENRGLLTAGKVDTPRGEKYAFGFMDHQAEGEARHFGHGGGAPGMNGDLQIYPQTGYVIAVLANMDPQAAGRISDFIVNRLPQK